MPTPNATGVHGSKRPAPASACTQTRNQSSGTVHGAGDRPATTDARRGHVIAVARPCCCCPPPCAIATACPPRLSLRCYRKAPRRLAERMQNARTNRTPCAKGRARVARAASGQLGVAVAQADGAIEHQLARPALDVAAEVALTLELHRGAAVVG